MAEVNVGAGVLFKLVPLNPGLTKFGIEGLEKNGYTLVANNYDSDTVEFQIGFTIAKSYLSKTDFKLIDLTGNINNLAHLPFDTTLNNGKNVQITNLEIQLSQENSEAPVVLQLLINLPKSKVGGAPIKVGGGAPVKVGGGASIGF